MADTFLKFPGFIKVLLKPGLHHLHPRKKSGFEMHYVFCISYFFNKIIIQMSELISQVFVLHCMCNCVSFLSGLV